MPLVRSNVATVSDGWAPCSSQWRARVSSSSIVEGSVCGLYCPIVSIVRPSRGERLSATTIRQIGFFLDPTRLSLIRTAIGRREVSVFGPWDAALLRSSRQLLRVGHLAGGHVTHHLAHLVELLDQLVDLLWPRPRAVGDAFAARALDQPGIGPLCGVIERMIASTRSSWPSSMSAFFSCFIAPMPGSMPRMPLSGPILRTWRIC